jgi:hypothetical protein
MPVVNQRFSRWQIEIILAKKSPNVRNLRMTNHSL